MASELHDILNTIRKDLHSEIDKVFTNGSHAIYIYLTKKLEETHSQQLKDIYARLDSLQGAPVFNKIVESRIPEVYFTDVKITEAIQNIEEEDGTVHEEDDVLTVHDEVSSSEIVEIVEEETIEDQMDLGQIVTELEDDQMEVEEVEEVEEDDHQVEVDVEQDVEEDQVEVEAEEDNSEPLNEIEVDGIAYYYDSNGDVWGLNEESEPVAIIGKYNEEDGGFELFSQDGDIEADQEPEGLQCEEFTYKGRTYLKDADDNVYTTEGEETGYKFLNNKLVKVA